MDKITIKHSAFAAKQEKPVSSSKEVRDEYYVPLWNSAEER